MPLMNKATGLKECSTCREVLKANEHFFASSTTKDGYQYRCKGCWGTKAADRPAGTVAPTLPAPAPRKPQGYTHTETELRELEQRYDLSFHGWLELDGMKMPIMHSTTHPPRKSKEA